MASSTRVGGKFYDFAFPIYRSPVSIKDIQSLLSLNKKPGPSQDLESREMNLIELIL